MKKTKELNMPMKKLNNGSVVSVAVTCRSNTIHNYYGFLGNTWSSSINCNNRILSKVSIKKDFTQ